MNAKYLKLLTAFAYGAMSALGGVIVRETYKVYSVSDPLVNKLKSQKKQREAEEKFKSIISQIDLSKE